MVTPIQMTPNIVYARASQSSGMTKSAQNCLQKAAAAFVRGFRRVCCAAARPTQRGGLPVFPMPKPRSVFLMNNPLAAFSPDSILSRPPMPLPRLSKQAKTGGPHEQIAQLAESGAKQERRALAAREEREKLDSLLFCPPQLRPKTWPGDVKSQVLAMQENERLRASALLADIQQRESLKAARG